VSLFRPRFAVARAAARVQMAAQAGARG
jgi:hypothetical protein